MNRNLSEIKMPYVKNQYPKLGPRKTNYLTTPRRIILLAILLSLYNHKLLYYRISLYNHKNRLLLYLCYLYILTHRILVTYLSGLL